MKLTTRQLKEIIREEIIRLTESEDNLQKLLNNSDPQVVMQGIELAEIMMTPIIFTKAPPTQIFFWLTKVEDPDLISLMVSDNQNVTVLNRISSNPNLSSETAEKLLSYQLVGVNRGLANNKNATPEILDRLSGDSNTRVVRAIANNTNTAAETLDRMAKKHKSDSYTLEAIFNNPNVSNETLMDGAQNPFGYPREVAEKVLKQRGVQIQYQQDQFTDEEMDEYEQMFGDQNDVDLSDTPMDDYDDEF